MYRSGPNHPNWKDLPDSGPIHMWLRKNFGDANKCENLHCYYVDIYGFKPRYEWSLLRGKKYEKKRENFWMLCKSCHFKYDLIPQKRWPNKNIKDKFS